MTDSPTRAQRFAAVVVPAAERAGYTGHGAKARFARDTGMTESSVTRLWQGRSLPDPRFFDAIAQAAGLKLGDLLVEAGVISHESLRTLSETAPSQVGSPGITPEAAADQLGITDPVGREMFFAMTDRLRRRKNDETPDHSGGHHGGTAAQM